MPAAEQAKTFTSSHLGSFGDVEAAFAELPRFLIRIYRDPDFGVAPNNTDLRQARGELEKLSLTPELIGHLTETALSHISSILEVRNMPMDHSQVYDAAYNLSSKFEMAVLPAMSSNDWIRDNRDVVSGVLISAALICSYFYEWCDLFDESGREIPAAIKSAHLHVCRMLNRFEERNALVNAKSLP